MKKSVLLALSLMAILPANATSSYQCSLPKASILWVKNKCYSLESKTKAFEVSVADRSFKLELRLPAFLKHDYCEAQFWLDHGVVVDQDFKDQKLSRAIINKDSLAADFWLKNGANFDNVAIMDGFKVIIDPSGRKILTVCYCSGGARIKGWDMGQQGEMLMLDLLKDYGIAEIDYDFRASN